MSSWDLAHTEGCGRAGARVRDEAELLPKVEMPFEIGPLGEEVGRAECTRLAGMGESYWHLNAALELPTLTDPGQDNRRQHPPHLTPVPALCPASYPFSLNCPCMSLPRSASSRLRCSSSALLLALNVPEADRLETGRAARGQAQQQPPQSFPGKAGVAQVSRELGPGL